jgi:hypothetical protein
VLRPFMKDFKPLYEEFHWLFNSYYNALGEEIPEKKLRASFSRPSLDEVVAYREHVDHAMELFLSRPIDDEPTRRVQRQIHVRSNGFARRLLRHTREPRARDISQLLSTGDPLAI